METEYSFVTNCLNDWDISESISVEISGSKPEGNGLILNIWSRFRCFMGKILTNSKQNMSSIFIMKCDQVSIIYLEWRERGKNEVLICKKLSEEYI